MKFLLTEGPLGGNAGEVGYAAVNLRKKKNPFLLPRNIIRRGIADTVRTTNSTPDWNKKISRDGKRNISFPTYFQGHILQNTRQTMG